MSARAAIAGLLVAVAAATAHGEELLYYVDGGEVVITNTPSRPDVKIVPGFGERVRAARGKLAPSRFDVIIDHVSRQVGIDPDLIKSVAYVESALDPSAVSPKGAMGLMQLMPATAESYGVRNPFDPHENLLAGARHLQGLLDEFGGDLTLALAAYNAGAGAVYRYRGVPAYAETQAYVKKVRSKLGRGELRNDSHTDSESEEHDGAISARILADGTVEYSN